MFKKTEVYDVPIAEPKDVSGMLIIARAMIDDLPRKRSQNVTAVYQLCQSRYYRTKLIGDFRRTFYKADKHYLKRIMRFLASHMAMLSAFVAPSVSLDELQQALRLALVLQTEGSTRSSTTSLGLFAV